MFSKHNHLGIIYFAKKFNLKKKSYEFRNNRIVIDNKETNLSTDQLRYISNICRVNKIKLYIRDDFKLAIKIKANGIFLSANNRRCLINAFFNKKNFEVLGSAHNQIDYLFKLVQNCSLITLSPIFFNPKYSKNKILNVIKFNLITKEWKINIAALGGITLKNFKQIKLTKAKVIGSRNLVENFFDVKKNLPMLNIGRFF